MVVVRWSGASLIPTPLSSIQSGKSGANKRNSPTLPSKLIKIPLTGSSLALVLKHSIAAPSLNKLVSVGKLILKLISGYSA